MTFTNDIIELNDVEVASVSAGAMQWSGYAWTGTGFTWYRGYADRRWTVIIPSGEDWHDS
jgi:hypothetical protein